MFVQLNDHETGSYWLDISNLYFAKVHEIKDKRFGSAPVGSMYCIELQLRESEDTFIHGYFETRELANRALRELLYHVEFEETGE